MKIPLKNRAGEVIDYCIIDDEDWEKVKDFNWCRRKDGTLFYVITAIKIRGKWTTIKISNLLMMSLKGEIVDHRSGDGLDNRKCNLRICTQQQNLFNQRKRKSGQSRYKGVRKVPKGVKKWAAEISIDRKKKHLGVFATEEQAAREYDKYAKIWHKEFACLNFE